MNRKILFPILLTALTIMVGGCSSEDELTPPELSSLTSGTDERPNWTQPKEVFEHTMSVQVQLGDTLVNFQSKQDLMCATIDDEIRAATGPLETGGVTYFPLTIGSNDASGTITLKYYCDRLHRIFVLKYWSTFYSSAETIGEDGIYRPKFIEL